MINVVSVSGGKDSTATLLVAIAMEAENLRAVFADTGHEHPQTYEYLDYLEAATGVDIARIKPDFSKGIQQKRERLKALLDDPERMGKFGWTRESIADALSVLHPSGIPFLDLCMWKERFPSAMARFCTEFLKRDPIFEQVFIPLLDRGEMVLSWQGVRADESLARRYLPECDEVGGGLFNYRPILKWPVSAVFEAHDYMGIKPNPLYTQGMSRVGCMPCVNCNKSELAEIAARFPEEIARVREWERLVSLSNKRGSATFFTATDDPTVSKDDAINFEEHGIDRAVEWAKTSRGGRQYDLIFAASDHLSCKSAYGLCEGPA